MFNTIIGKQVLRKSRNLLISNGILMAILLGVAGWQYRYLYNFALGPFPVDAKNLEDIKSLDDSLQQYITVKGNAIDDTGVQQITKRVRRSTGQTISQSVSAKYQTLQLDKRILLVKSGISGSSNQVTGGLSDISSEIKSRIVTPIESQDSSLKGAFLPFMLDTNDYRLGGYVVLLFALPLSLVSIWQIVSALRWRSDLGNHPIRKRLAKIGDWQTLIQEIDTEASSGINTVTIGGNQLTRSWLLQLLNTDIKAIKLDQLVWAYKKVTSTKYGKIYSAVLYDRYGEEYGCPCSNEADVELLLKELFNRFPYLILGYSDELQKMWKRERQKMIDSVDQAHQAVL
ncbi:hypothetical protein B9G53_06435 [Pseudanabaena sp. SR411]|uniref:DUF6709 family protein n=1 Tax=Pseudanabaena sp. SR411 TaxID=1980935 RepID=UPI000B98595D|nr:DUF6709 family protein [Pseudanabaena sp. SR411]OYQ65689.1 hypothetical protein B9G53_06435 [Pseudanabaena sp. SR411]